MAAAELEVDRNLKAASGPRYGLLTLAIKDKGALYQAYLPFVKNGGIFLPAGIGVQFSKADRGVTQKKIESHLAGALAGDKPIHTM